MRKYFTTTEYIKALKLQLSGNMYECKGKEFAIFSNKAAAEYDAQWLVDFYKREGKKRKKPEVLEIIFRPIKRRGKE